MNEISISNSLLYTIFQDKYIVSYGEEDLNYYVLLENYDIWPFKERRVENGVF